MDVSNATSISKRPRNITCHRFVISVSFNVNGNQSTTIPIPACRSLPYIQGLSVRRFRTYNINIAHKPTESLRRTLVIVKNPLPTQKRWEVMYKIPYSECLRGTNKSAVCHMHERTPQCRWATGREFAFWPFIAS